ncbi:hypothetical protein JCM8547_008835 [Rhodosporidiobolus lusitaniae]
MLVRSSTQALRSSRPPRTGGGPRWSSSSSSSSSSRSRSPPPPPPPRPAKEGAPLLRNVALGVAAGGAFTLWDKEYNASAFARSIRTSIFGITLALDFKLNFDPSSPTSVEKLHERTAKRLARLVERNAGLYVKLAQALAIQAAILPKPYREVFNGIFDSAPGIEWDEVVRVFQKEFGVHPDEAFLEIEHEPIASASIAQVHKARLRPPPGQATWSNETDGWVAVKVRKEAIPKQMEWDLFCYRALTYSFEKLFDLPVHFVSKFISEQMRKEVDLRHEAQNAEKTAQFVKKDKELREKVSVPKVEWEWTGESVMTAEFVNACRLTDKQRLAEWSLSLKETMDTATALFSEMVFSWGHVQADPHPGNILVRPNPKRPSHPQIVLIDHGLYITLPPAFRQQYCLLWRSLFTGDVKAIEDIASSWGIRRENSNIFASLTLLRPHKLRRTKAEEDAKKREQEGGDGTVRRLDQGVGLKERIKTMLESEEKIPRELIFVTRAMRMMQGNNQSLGSPTNRINLLAHHAARGLSSFPPSSHPPPSSSLTRSLLHPSYLPQYLSETLRLAVFKVVLFAVDVGFVLTRVRAWVLEKTGRMKRGEGMEDLLQRQVTDMARAEFGVELDDNAFVG